MQLTDKVLNESRTVYENQLTGLQRDYISFDSDLYTIIAMWYNERNEKAADKIRGYKVVKNGAGFRWSHGSGYDIFGDLFALDTLQDSIKVVNEFLKKISD